MASDLRGVGKASTRLNDANNPEAGHIRRSESGSLNRISLGAERRFGCIVDRYASQLDSNVATHRQAAIQELYAHGAVIGLNRSAVDDAIAAYDERKYEGPEENRDHDSMCAAERRSPRRSLDRPGNAGNRLQPPSSGGVQVHPHVPMSGNGRAVPREHE